MTNKIQIRNVPGFGSRQEIKIFDLSIIPPTQLLCLTSTKNFGSGNLIVADKVDTVQTIVKCVFRLINGAHRFDLHIHMVEAKKKSHTFLSIIFREMLTSSFKPELSSYWDIF